MREFNCSEATEAVEFMVGDELFTAVPPAQLPGIAVMRYTESVGAGLSLSAHLAFFAAVLEDESFARFAAKLDSKEDPITLSVMVDVVSWMLADVYSGGRALRRVS